MNYKIYPSKLSGEIVAPPSKSIAHRFMIASALAGVYKEINNVGSSNDIETTSKALCEIGFFNKIIDNNCIFLKNVKVNNTIVDCEESGTTLRLLLPIVSALGIKTQFTGSENLLSRPLEGLIACLNSHGAKIDNLQVNGKLIPGDYEIDASVSSQYISGLLFALPLLGDNSKIILNGSLVSSPYVDMTINIISKFGINIERTDYGFFVHHGKYKFNGNITIEGDYSGSAFFMVAGLKNGNLKINNLKKDSIQGDRKIIDIIKRFGGNIETYDNYVVVNKSILQGCDVDCESIPDLAQPLSILGCIANGKTILKNISRLKYKESDRLNSILEMLNKAKIEYNFDGNDLIIVGGNPISNTYNGYNDHRNIMMYTILSLYSIGESEILGVEAVSKSYPDFFNDFKKLGGKYVEI